MSAVYEPILSGEAAVRFGDSLLATRIKEYEAYVGNHDSGYRAKEDSVTTHER
jgi:3-methyladenine DNA glycosylase Mpg